MTRTAGLQHAHRVLFLFIYLFFKYINLILHVSYISATSLALYYARTHAHVVVVARSIPKRALNMEATD